jgi:hypothetical protein
LSFRTSNGGRIVFVRNSASAGSWTSFSWDITAPVFPQIPASVRPYVLALWLFAVTSGLMYIGDNALLRFGLPWALVSLLVVILSANIWGVGPAFVVLGLSVLFSLLTVPDRVELTAPNHTDVLRILLVRSVLFVACGVATVWLTFKARRMHDVAQKRRTMLMSLRRPDSLPKVPGFDLYATYRAVQRDEDGGGDFYDLYPNGSGQYGILIGDIATKGKSTASTIALLRFSVRAFAATGMGPAEVLTRIKELIDTQEAPVTTASLFFGLMDVRTGVLRYANAGHEPPFLKRANGNEEALLQTAPMFGVHGAWKVDEVMVTFGESDALLLLSDGVTEARDKEGFFMNTEGVWRMLRSTHNFSSSRKAIHYMESALINYSAGGKRDDVTLLLIRGMGPEQKAA